MSEGIGSKLKIAGIVRESIVDGPGIRFVIFSQGCPHHCEGCHNEATHGFDGGYECSIQRLLKEIDKDPILQGVTFSGGEPMCQAEAFLELAREIKKRGLNLVIFTGYTYEGLLEMDVINPVIGELLELTDYLIDGPFILSQRDLTLQFKGSRNQRTIDVKATRSTGKLTLCDEL